MDNYYIILILIISIYFLLKKDDRATSINKKIPGPKGIPFFGNILDVIGNRHLRYQEYYKKYGSVFRVKYGGIEKVVLTGYPTIKEAFVNQSIQFQPRYIRKRKFLSKIYSLNNFQGLIISNGDYHKNLKSVVLSELTPTKIKKMETHINEETKRLCDLFEKHANEGKEIILNKYFNLFSINIILRFLFGINFPYEDLNGSSVELIETVQRFFKMASQPMLSDYLPIPHPFPERPREFYQLYRKLAKHILKMIENYKNKKNEQKDGADENNDNGVIVEKLLVELEEGRITKMGLMAVIIDIFSAGVDTVAQTLMFSIISLVNNQSIQDKLYHSLVAVIPKGEEFSYSKYKQSIPYLSLVIKETYRKYPVGVLGLPHEVIEDCVIDGHTIAKGTQIIQNLYASHRDEKFWSNPDEFIPERFLEKDVTTLHHFGVGPRNCLGSALADCETTSAIATLIGKFNFINPNPSIPLNDNGDFSIALVAPQTKLIVKKRS